MKNLDNSLLGSANLDESISNTDGQGTTSSSNTGAAGWQDAIAASIALTNQVIQTRNTPKNETEQACGVKPLFAGARKNAWDKCAESYNTSKTYTPTNTNNNPAPEPKKFPWLLVGGITFGVLALATTAYFVFRKK
jgi:hypothetical protein